MGAHERGPSNVSGRQTCRYAWRLAASADSRIDDLRNLSSPDFDFRKLIRLCEELNTAYNNGCYFAALPNGAACSSQFYTCSHVLSAMRLPEDQKAGALRLSWRHLTPTPDFAGMVQCIRALEVPAATG